MELLKNGNLATGYSLVWHVRHVKPWIGTTLVQIIESLVWMKLAADAEMNEARVHCLRQGQADRRTSSGSG